MNILKASLLAAVAALAVATAAPAAPQAKAPPCWKTLINDWYDGRIDGTYPIHCYREALDHLPTDVDTYSSARDDIRQALQERITQSRNGGGSSDGETTTTAGGGGKNGGTSGGTDPTTPGGGPTTPIDPNNPDGPITNAIDAGRPGKADALPIPLLVLGGVALLLMAAGAAGFLSRRLRTRRVQLASAATLPVRPQTPADGR